MGNILAVAVLMVVALLIWARRQERTAVFFPERELHGNPGSMDLAFENVYFESDGLKLHGWHVPGSGPVTVLWLHGNAGNISDRLDLLADMNRNLGVSSFIFDFRGYGNSGGRPTEKGLYQDAAAAFMWLTDEYGVDPASVVIFGHSLGSAPAVDLACGKGRKAGGVVLESSFSSARDMARLMYGGLPVDWLMSLKLDVAGRVGKLEMPLLVIHGEQDMTVPFEMGKEVFEAAAEPKSFMAVPGADHSDCYLVGGNRYWEAWKGLISPSKPGQITFEAL